MNIWWRLLTNLAGVPSTITACGCLCSLGWCFCALCCLWAPSAAQCSSIITSGAGFQALETAHTRKKTLSPILLHESGSLRTQLPRQVRGAQCWGLWPCSNPCLQWIKHPHLSTHWLLTPESPQVFLLPDVFWNKYPPVWDSWERINFPWENVLGIKQERDELSWLCPCCRDVPDTFGTPRLHSPPLQTFLLTPAPSTHRAKGSKALSHQHPCTRSLCSPRPSPARSCFAPISACTFVFPDFSSVWHLPEAAQLSQWLSPQLLWPRSVCWP